MPLVEQFFFHLSTRRARRHHPCASEILWISPWIREARGVHRHFMIAGVSAR